VFTGTQLISRIVLMNLAKFDLVSFVGGEIIDGESARAVSSAVPRAEAASG